MSLFEIPLCPADDPTGTPVETLTKADVSALKISISLNDLGEVRITMPRNRWQALGLDMRESYYGRVKIPHIDADSYVQGFWLVAGEMILVSTDERGGEDITIGGPGPAWILTRAVLNHEEWTDHTGVYVQDGTWYFSGKSHGDILSILLAEDAASNHPALDGMESAGWGANLDVDGNAWEQFGGIFSQPVGTNFFDVIRQVQRGGEFEWWVSPSLNLRAYKGTYGRDLSGNSYGAGVVRFVGSDVTPDENHNIIGNLARRKDKGGQFTHVLVMGNDRRENSHVIEGSPIHRWAVDPDWSTGDYVREGYMEYPTNSTDILIRAGLRMIERSKDRSGRMASFEVMPGRDEDEGLYLPGAPGTDRGNYWIGDTVTIKTGGAEGIDFLNRDLRIAKIRIELDQAAKDDTLETRDRSWHTFIETGDDLAPTASAASSANEKGTGGHCKCLLFAPECQEQEADTETVLTHCFDPTNGISWPGSIITSGSCWGGDEHRSAGASASQTGLVTVSPGDIIKAELNFREETGDDSWENNSNYAYRAVLRLEGSGPDLDTTIVNNLYHNTGCINVTHTATATVPSGYSGARIVFRSRLGGWRYCGQILEITVADPVDNHPFCVVGGGSSPYAARSDDPRFHTTHTASDVEIVDEADYFTGTNVEEALQEIGAELDAGLVTDHGDLTGLTDDDHTQYILKSLVDAKGDILAGTGADVISRLGVGSDGQILSADSSQSTGLIWIDPPEAGSGTGAGEILISDTPSTPLIFADLLQNEAQTDLLYEDVEEGGGGGGVTDHGSLTGLGDVDHNYVRGDSGENYRMVACVVRKTGGAWVLLNDATHVPIGVSSISSDSDSVDIAFSFTAAKIGAVVVGADETWAELYHFGPSVTTTEARVGITDMDGNPVDPTTVANSSSANFWLIGLMEV